MTSDELRQLAIDNWGSFSDEEKTKVIATMGNQPVKDKVWVDFLRSQPVDELIRLSSMQVEMTDKPLDVEGRAFVKNFANDPNAAVEYLREQNPNVKNIRWRNGKIVGQHEGEGFDRVLDPRSFSLGEAAKDAVDVAYDVGAGVATGIASVAPALTGPGAMFSPLAGGTVSAGAEALRQSIGTMGGIPQSPDMMDVGAQFIAGAAPPGVGKALGYAGSKAAPIVAKHGPKLAGGFVRQATSNPAVPHKLSGYLGEKTKKLLTPKAGPNMSKEPIMRQFAKEQAMTPAQGKSLPWGVMGYGGIQSGFNPYMSMLREPASTGGGVSPRYQ